VIEEAPEIGELGEEWTWDILDGRTDVSEDI
jgi:hypothetical protein